jgi:Ca2+-dependent lipid-binding protein
MAMLSVTLLRASDLVASDSALEGVKSDPFVVFQVGKEIQQSTCIEQQLNPVWHPRECFDFPIVHPDKAVLRIDVYDYDSFSAHDLIGSLVLPVSKYAQYANIPQHEVFFLDVPDSYASQECKSTIELEICFLSDARDGQHTLRMWENEVWSLATGWAASNTEIYKRYSSYDDSVTSNQFQVAAPRVPEGMEGLGWSFCVDANRSEHGWVYAYNFLGPFSVEKTMNSYVRRRIWENKCVAAKD